MKTNTRRESLKAAQNAQGKNRIVKKEPELPGYITGEEDLDVGQLYAPVDLDKLLGQGIACDTKRPYSLAEILGSLAEGDRAEFKKSVKKGFSPLLFLDLFSGAAAIEMRRASPPPSPPTRAHKELHVARAKSHDA